MRGECLCESNYSIYKMRETKVHLAFLLLTLSSLHFRGLAAEFLVEKPENDDNLILAHTVSVSID